MDEFEPQIRALLSKTPTMPATVIAERIGWSRSASVLRAKVAELRPLFAPSDPADRTEYRPGEIVQCDLWFPPKVVRVAADVDRTSGADDGRGVVGVHRRGVAAFPHYR